MQAQPEALFSADHIVIFLTLLVSTVGVIWAIGHDIKKDNREIAAEKKKEDDTWKEEQKEWWAAHEALDGKRHDENVKRLTTLEISTAPIGKWFEERLKKLNGGN